MLAGPSPAMSSNVTPNDSQGGNLMVSNGHLMTIWITGFSKIGESGKSRFWGDPHFRRKYRKLPRYFDVRKVPAGIHVCTCGGDTGFTRLLGGLSPWIRFWLGIF